MILMTFFSRLMRGKWCNRDLCFQKLISTSYDFNLEFSAGHHYVRRFGVSSSDDSFGSVTSYGKRLEFPLIGGAGVIFYTIRG